MAQIDSTWIKESNLPAVLEVLSGFAEYCFDEADWQAIRYGMSTTEYEKDQWFSYVFVGKVRIEFSLALDLGASVVFLKIDAPGALCVKIETLLELAACRRIESESSWLPSSS